MRMVTRERRRVGGTVGTVGARIGGVAFTVPILMSRISRSTGQTIKPRLV